ncbi:MAG: penicillin acylase family protein, partial [Deltaproteobacteria bacterium]|jgi:penicillin amidase|nr:penicillin acylase family protein [Deltaproteobacteria bacterium]
VINPFGASPLNRYAGSGSLDLPGLKEPVTVHRDEKGMAYIYAANLEDLFFAQGFVTAQDRLFQMELTKLFASGRISELAGEKARDVDIRMRTLGFHRNATKHIALLNERTRMYFQKYVDGVNAFIETRPQEHHLEFKLAGIRPSIWSSADSLTILYFMGWNSAGNMQSEIIAQMLVEKLGPDKAADIFPLNINPDDEPTAGAARPKRLFAAAGLGAAFDNKLLAHLDAGSLQLGSNNWAVNGKFSPGGKPILANDPHLEATLLPGPWYPCGLITPQFRAVGVNIPGLAGMPIGRTAHIAMGVTNAYGDTQDLYVETLDPDNPGQYLEGNRSIPFEVIEETLKIKDKSAAGGYRTEKIKIRRTRRGPVISGVMPGLQTDKVISMRWSSFEAMAPSVGFERLMECRTISEVRQALEDVNQVALNYVVADSRGNIGWSATGKLPIRTQGQALVPFVVTDSMDNWTGWIPWEQMPHAVNPARGWLGTCNHMTVNRVYPYYYANPAASSYRYRRLMELMDTPGKKTDADHWAFQRDTVNLMAQAIGPIMARALAAHDDTAKMGRILSAWDFHDDPEGVAPTIFQAVYREFALLVYADELGDELARNMLDEWYFWQERLQHMVLEGTSDWFDNIRTVDRRETRDDLFHQAGLNAIQYLSAELGDKPDKWQWGKVHRHDFLSPIRRSGAGKDILGGGSHASAGSGETLYRGIYDFNAPFKITISASMRMVVDMSDPDKILAVLPGGVSGRQFDPHTTDQVEPFMNGDSLYWWFSDRAIKAHTRRTLTLKPR